MSIDYVLTAENVPDKIARTVNTGTIGVDG